MSKSPTREWRFYLSDMIAFADKAMTYTDGLSFEEFTGAGITYDATLRNLELIGEAATKIPPEIREKYSDIPWRMIIATRNRLIHGYLGIDDRIVWSIISDELPSLITELRTIAAKNAQ